MIRTQTVPGTSRQSDPMGSGRRGWPRVWSCSWFRPRLRPWLRVWVCISLGLIASHVRADLYPLLCDPSEREVMVEVAAQRATDVLVVGPPTRSDAVGALIVREVFKGNRHPGEPFRFPFLTIGSRREHYLLFAEPDTNGPARSSWPPPAIVADSVIFCAKPEEWWPKYRERIRTAIERQHPRSLRDSSDLSVEGIVEEYSEDSWIINLRVIAAVGRAGTVADVPPEVGSDSAPASTSDAPAAAPAPGTLLRISTPHRVRMDRNLVPPTKVGDRAIFFLARTDQGGYALQGGLFSKWRLEGAQFQVEANHTYGRNLAFVEAAKLRDLLGLPVATE